MFLIKFVFISCFIFYILLGLGQCLVTLPEVEDNNIIHAESVIRTTVNSLFSNLGIKKVRDKPRLKQYSVAHNYFVSLTLQDYNNLKEIAKLTRVVKSNLSDVTTYYIDLINKILDEDNVQKIQRTILGEHLIPEYDIEGDKVKIESMNKYHEELKDKYTDMNEEVLKVLLQEQNRNLGQNDPAAEDKKIQDSNENVLEDLPIWYGNKELSGRRLFDAKQTKIKKFPFMASVQIFNKFQCGGSIIKSDLVITAASCLQLAWNNRFYRENPAFLSVRIGSSYYEVGGENIAVMEVYFHPEYNPKNLHNNIAVMRLIRLIRMRRKKRRVKKILLDDEEGNMPLNVMGVEILGWGAHSKSNKLYGPWEDKLRHATINVYPLDDCQEVYSKEYVTKKHFCAGTLSVGSGACNRDVGGPGIVSGKLAGIISFGSPVCGTPDTPTVFTKVGYYYDWIEEIMEQDVPRLQKRTTSLPSTYPYAPPKVYSPRYKWTLIPITTASVLDTTGDTSNLNEKNNMEQAENLMNSGLFQDFLRTMFKSAEIEQYFDAMNSSAELVTPRALQLKVQQPIVNKTEGIQPITDETANQSLYYILNQDPITPNTLNMTLMGITTEIPSNSDSESSDSSEERVPSSNTVTKSYLREGNGINSSNVSDLVMEYDKDFAKELEPQEIKLPVQEIERQENKQQFFDQTAPSSTTNEMPIRSQTSMEIPSTPLAYNEKFDNALLSLLYISDNEMERMAPKPDKSNKFDYDERNNNQEPFIQPVAPEQFKDLTYRIKNTDSFKNLRKLLNDDLIINFIKQKITEIN